MNTTFTIATVTGLSAMLTIPVLAIDPPKDNALPPVVRNRIINIEKSAYLGIVTNTIPEALAAHLGTETGLIITGVMPNSAAANAGLSQHDIITRIDSQEVNTPDQLRELVRSKKPGDALHLETLHQGKPRQVEVTLSERNARRADMNAPQLQGLNLGVLPSDFEKRIREMIEGNLGSFELNGQQGNLLDLDIDRLQGNMGMIQPDIENMMRNMSGRLQQQMFRFNDPASPDQHDGALQFQQNSSIRILDQEGSIEISSKNGIRQLTVRDTENQEVWSGPWNTENDKQAAPDAIRKRADKLNLESSIDGNSLKLELKPSR